MNIIEPLNSNELINIVSEFKKHWVGKYLAKAFISCYRGTKTQIDLRLFNSLDPNNQTLFVQILNMRTCSGWSDESLYQTEVKLKKIVGIK